MVTQTADAAIDLAALDVSRGELYATDSWRPLFAQLRRDDPVHFCKDSPFGPYWSVTRHADIVEVESRPDVYSSSWEHGGIVIFDMQDTNVQLRMFIAMDDPEHAQHRQTIAPGLTPQVLKGLAPLIRERTAEVLADLPRGEPVDWVEKVSVELTTRMLATLMDFPWDQRHKLPVWSDWAARIDIGPDPVLNAEREAHCFEMAAAFKALFDQRKAEPPKGDLLSIMAHSSAMADLDDQRFLGTIALLVVGGNDTTRNSMSGLVEQINRCPEQWEKVRGDPGLASTAATEVIRLQTPICHMRRTVVQDTVLHGKQLKAGDKVVLWYNSANRDEEVFADAEVWDVTRENSRRMLSWGYGVHRCLGARLAELQLVTLIEEIIRQDLRIDLIGEPERLPSCFTRGYHKMMVRVSQGGRP
jgi:cytochrome P450